MLLKCMAVFFGLFAGLGSPVVGAVIFITITLAFRSARQGSVVSDYMLPAFAVAKLLLQILK